MFTSHGKSIETFSSQKFCIPSCRRSAGGRPGPMGKRPPWARHCRGPGASDGWDFIQDVGKKVGNKTPEKWFSDVFSWIFVRIFWNFQRAVAVFSIRYIGGENQLSTGSTL